MLTAERERTAQLPKRTRAYCSLSTHIKAQLYVTIIAYLWSRARDKRAKGSLCTDAPSTQKKLGRDYLRGRGICTQAT